jgi:hypothetical protein
VLDGKDRVVVVREKCDDAASEIASVRSLRAPIRQIEARNSHVTSQALCWALR